MPFYEYKCSACGETTEVLQKMGADPLVDCPTCGQSALHKLVSAPAFSLKGTGWYVTDFKDGKKNTKSQSADSKEANTSTTGDDTNATAQNAKTESTSVESAKTESTKTESKSKATTATTKS